MQERCDTTISGMLALNEAKMISIRLAKLHQVIPNFLV